MNWTQVANDDDLDVWGMDHGQDFRSCLMAFDRSRSLDWPRQRSHFAITDEVDGWHTVFELHDFGAFDPRVDEVHELEVVAVSIEPAGELPLGLRRVQRHRKNVEHDRMIQSPPAEMKKYPKKTATVGERPAVTLPTSGLLKPSAGARRAVVAMTAAVNGDERRRDMPLWFQLPTPLSSPPKRGPGARSGRDWAELAKLFIASGDHITESRYPWLVEQFGDHFGVEYWRKVAHDLHKREQLQVQDDGFIQLTRLADMHLDQHLGSD